MSPNFLLEQFLWSKSLLTPHVFFSNLKNQKIFSSKQELKWRSVIILLELTKEVDMTRIVGTWTQQIEVPGLTKVLKDQIQNHPAWNARMDEKQAESLLMGQSPFTYILRKEAENQHFFISFVKPDQSIKHQKFSIELDYKGWYFKNGTAEKAREIVDDNLETLILAMMQCHHDEAKIFKTDSI